jgi:hypothetical protein
VSRALADRADHTTFGVKQPGYRSRRPSNSEGTRMGSVIKKRRKRMSKKKHRKLLRKTRHARRKAGK